MKKRKLNKTNLMLVIVFTLSLVIIITDFSVITINTLLGKTSGWTWFGFISFMIAGIFLDWTITELKIVIDNKKEK